MQRSSSNELEQAHELGSKRLNSDDRKNQKRGKSSSELNGMQRSPSGVVEKQNGKTMGGPGQNGIPNGLSLDSGSPGAATLQSLVAAQNAGSVSDQLRDYTQALQWISLQGKNGFPQQYPSPLVQTGAVPPPNLPMPVGAVPDSSFQALPMNDSSAAMPLSGSNGQQLNGQQLSRVPLQLNQSSLFQLTQYMNNGAALPVMIPSMEPTQQLQDLSQLIAANSNSILAMKPPPTNLSSAIPPGASGQDQPSDAKPSLQGLKRSHGPSVDRYKNRWSETEIANLRNGYARFGKGGTVDPKEGDDNGRTSESQYRKGDSEQVWERILRTYEFQPCRTPRDLKDKWRQLKKKEQDDKLGVREEARRLRLLSTGPGGSLSSTSNGNSNSGDNGSSTSSSHSRHGANNDHAADALDSPEPSSASPPGGSSSGSTSSPAPPTNASTAVTASNARNRSSGSPPPSPSPSGSPQRNQARGGGSESGRSNEEGGSEGSGQDRDSGGADGGSEGSEGDSAEGGAVVARQEEAVLESRRQADEAEWEGRTKRKRMVEEAEGGCVGLALNLGSSTVTASLIRTDGSAVAGGVGQRAVHLHPSTLTLNADEYLEAVCGCIDDAVAFVRSAPRSAKRQSINGKTQAASPSSSTSNGPAAAAAGGGGGNGVGLEPAVSLPVKVVGMACFAMSLVGVSDSGDAVTPVYTHADTRNAAFASELRRKLSAEGSLDFVERRTAAVQSCYAPALLTRLQQTPQEDTAKVATWQTLSCFVLSKLSGRPQPVTLSEASLTGLMDRVDQQWHHGLLSLLGVSPRALPPLCDADELHDRGLSEELRQRWPELADAMWSRGISHGAAASVGCRCEAPRRVCVTIGASAEMRLCLTTRQSSRKRKGLPNGRSKTPAASNGKASPLGDGDRSDEIPRGLFCYTLTRDTQLVGAALADGASIYEWAQRELAGTEEEMASMVAAASKMDADSHGLTILPFFSGNTGSGFQDAKATVTGMTLRTTRGELLRGMLESVALRLKGIYNRLCQISDDADEVQVYASGETLFASPLWQQILADALEVPIRLDAGAAEASAVGAAVIALRAAGLKAHVTPVTERQVYPRAEGVAAMQMAFERQEALYNRLYRR